MVWFAIYAALFVLPLVILLVVFLDHDDWFLRLSIFWALSVALLASRGTRGAIHWTWRALLAFVMAGSWAYCTLLVLAAPGDTQICYDRVSPASRTSLGYNLGPDPLCDGTPLQEVETD